jgi:hypothetical protein
VLAPQQFEQLRLLLDRMLRPDNPPHGWVRKQLAELAVVKLHAAIHCLRHHYQTGQPTRHRALLTALRVLREPLDAEAHGRRPTWPGPWAAVRDLLPDRLLRRLDRSTTDPGSIRFRATAVEEFTLRSEPTEAYVELVVSAGDSPTLGTARAVNGINVLVLVGVAVLLGVAHSTNDSRADVLATLLTIFPTLQASRLEQPDSTRLAGPADHAALPGRAVHRGPGAGAGRRARVRPEGRGCWSPPASRCCCRSPATCGSGCSPTTPPRPAAPAPGHAGHRPVGRPPGVRRAALGLVPVADRGGAAARPHRVPVRRRGPGRAGALVDLIAGAQGEMTESGTGLRKVWQDIRTPVPAAAAAGRRAPAPVNLLGVLRGTAVGRSATFLVFRDPPKAGLGCPRRPPATRPASRYGRSGRWPRPGQAGPDGPAGLGARRDDRLAGRGAGVRRRPARPDRAGGPAGELHAAQRAAAAPPPLQDPAERRWLRLRVGAPYRRGDSLRKLVRFLAALDALRAEGLRVHLREVPQMESVDATQTAPEDSFDELPGARVPTTGKTVTGRLVTDHDVRSRPGRRTPGGWSRSARSRGPGCSPTC